MGLRSLIGLLSVVSVFALVGCNKDAQRVEPATQGKRGENCQARNDCEQGLACLSGICAKNEFADVEVATKQCDRIECAQTSDCCGDKPTKAPAKCNDRQSICLTPTVADCTTKVCTSDANCGEGTCLTALGNCSGTLSGACETVADCLDVCTTSGYCARSTTVACTVDSECSYYTYNTAATCVTATRTCRCNNPDYLPSSPVCTDPDCTDVCLLRCEDERCVTDKSCEKNADCTAFGLPLCDSGRCVECKSSTDCDETSDETCEDGQCHKPCEHNEECALFEECNKKTGECTYVGCKTDRECILAANRPSDPTAPTGGVSTSGEDPRLLKCLPSEANASIKTCKIPCENDGSCGAQSVCSDGYCKFIGCDSDEECRAYLGIANQMSTEAKPFVVTAICRD